MFSLFAPKENQRAVAFLEHFRTSLYPWTLVVTRNGKAGTVSTFVPQLHGAASAWIAKANKGGRNVMVLIAETKGAVAGVQLVQGHIQGTRHFAVRLHRKDAAKLEAFRPAPFLRLDAGARTFAVWRLINEVPTERAEAVARAVAAKLGGIHAEWLVPLAGTTYEGAPVELAYLYKDRVNVLTDFTATHATAQEAVQSTLFTPATSITAESETWLWPGVVLSGALTLLTGQPKVGKTQITLDVAARVSSGGTWPTGEDAIAGRVAVFEIEDKGAKSIKPRLAAMGADMANVVIRDSKDGPLNLADGMDSLASQLAVIGGVRLLTLSPLLSFFGQQASDDTEVRRRLAPMLKWAAETDTAIIGVLHPPKKPGASLEAQFAGADTYRRAARAAWVVMPDPEDDEPNIKRKRRALVSAGINGAPDDKSHCFRIKGAEVDGITTSRIEWECVEGSDASGEARPTHRTSAETRTNPSVAGAGRQSKATRWLREALAHGPRHATELKEAAKATGIHEPTLYRAKRTLGVTSVGSGVGREMIWSLPVESGGQA